MRCRVPKRPAQPLIDQYRAQLIAGKITRGEIAKLHGVTAPTVSRWTGPILGRAWKRKPLLEAEGPAPVYSERRERELAKRERLRRELGQYLLINNQVKSIIG